MLVLRQRAPHTAVNAISQSRQVWDWRAFRSRLKRSEDKFRGRKLGEMGFEGRHPWGSGRDELLGCGRHVAENGAKAEER